MKKYILPLILILLLTFTLIGNCVDWLSGWDKRIEISIEDYDGDIGASVTWFPVTVFLTATQGEEVFTELTTDGEYLKIQITESDGTTKLYGEMELFDVSEKKGIFHVSRDGWTINANTSVFLYYDSTQGDNTDYIGVIGSTPGEKVWNDDYKTVHHKKNATTTTVLDSTSNDNDGTKKAENQPIEVAGSIGFAQHYDGNDDYIGLADNSFESDSLGTIEAIINRDVAARDDDVIFSSSELGASNLLKFVVSEASGFNLYMQHYIVGTGAHNDVIYGDVVLGTTEHYVAVTSSGTAWALFVDGVADAANVLVGSNTGDWFAELGAGTHKNRIGSVTYGATPATYAMAGIIDEFRYSSVVRSAEWVKGTSNTLLDALFTYGSEEEAPAVEEVNAIWFGTNF